MEWAVCTASSDSEDTAAQGINEEEGTPSIGDQEDSLQESLPDTQPPTQLVIDNKVASTGNCWDAAQWSAWVSSNFPDNTPAINEEEGELSKWGQQDSLDVGKIELGTEYTTKDTQKPSDLMKDNEAAPTRNCWDPVQCTGWDASSYTEETTTPEINEKEGEFSNTGQQDSLNETKIVAESTTNTAQRSIEIMIANEIASIRNSWSLMGSVKAEAGDQPPDAGSPLLSQFKKGEGSKLSAPDCMRSTCKVNISARDGTSDSEPEGLTMRDDEDGEEDVLVTPEDSGESAEDIEFPTNGVSQKLYPGRSEVQRKKSNLTEDRLGQASTECGENSTDPSICNQSRYGDKSCYERWFETYQTRHLEGTNAVWETLNCTESKDMLSRSSELVEHQAECATESKDIFSQSSEIIFRCDECKITFSGRKEKRRHNRTAHKRKSPYKCPDCSARFLNTSLLKRHLISVHNVHETFDCAQCRAVFSKFFEWSQHHCAPYEELPLDCKDCHILLKDAFSLRKHQKKCHGEKPYKCTACSECFAFVARLRQHQWKRHNMEKRYSCSSCPETFIDILQFQEHQHVHTGAVRYKCTECVKTFRSEKGLKYHQRIHGDKSLSVPIALHNILPK